MSRAQASTSTGPSSSTCCSGRPSAAHADAPHFLLPDHCHGAALLPPLRLDSSWKHRRAQALERGQLPEGHSFLLLIPPHCYRGPCDFSWRNTVYREPGPLSATYHPSLSLLLTLNSLSFPHIFTHIYTHTHTQLFSFAKNKQKPVCYQHQQFLTVRNV